MFLKKVFCKMQDTQLKEAFKCIHNKQHFLQKMLELWKKTLDKDKSVGAIFMNLSKAFDTLNHNLIIAEQVFQVFRKFS